MTKNANRFISIAMWIFWSMLCLVSLGSSYTLAYTNMNPMDDIGLMAIFLPMLFVLFIVPVSFLCWLIGNFWNESFPNVWIRRSKQFSILMIVGSILIYVIFLEVNPLKQYGVEFLWHPGGSGSWYSVQPIVKHGNKMIEGPDIGMTYPWLSFKDIDNDGIKDILVTSQLGGDNQVVIIFKPAQHGEPPYFFKR